MISVKETIYTTILTIYILNYFFYNSKSAKALLKHLSSTSAISRGDSTLSVLFKIWVQAKRHAYEAASDSGSDGHTIFYIQHTLATHVLITDVNTDNRASTRDSTDTIIADAFNDWYYFR